MNAIYTPAMPQGEIVRVQPNTLEAQAAIAKYGGWFWQRPIGGTNAYLIPLHNGIPVVHEFIIVPSSDVVKVENQVGYGNSTTHEGSGNGNSK